MALFLTPLPPALQELEQQAMENVYKLFLIGGVCVEFPRGGEVTQMKAWISESAYSCNLLFLPLCQVLKLFLNFN